MSSGIEQLFAFQGTMIKQILMQQNVKFSTPNYTFAGNRSISGNVGCSVDRHPAIVGANVPTQRLAVVRFASFVLVG